MASGIPVHIGSAPQITGSDLVTTWAVDTLDEHLGAKFLVEADMAKAAEIMDARISEKRLALGLTTA